jgi:ketosteroid isomerase-like protein
MSPLYRFSSKAALFGYSLQGRPAPAFTRKRKRRDTWPVMSHENVEIVGGVQPQPDVDLVTLLRDEAGAASLAEAFAPLLHDDFEAVGSAGFETQHSTGLAGLREVWLAWLEPWESYRVEIEDVIDAGDDVLVLTRDYGRRRGMEAEVSVLGGAVWTVLDGKIVRAAFYPDRSEAIEAAGLST